MVLFRNIIQLLDKNNIEIDKISILKAYEIYSNYLDTFKSPNIKFTEIIKSK